MSPKSIKYFPVVMYAAKNPFTMPDGLRLEVECASCTVRFLLNPFPVAQSAEMGFFRCPDCGACHYWLGRLEIMEKNMMETKRIPKGRT